MRVVGTAERPLQLRRLVAGAALGLRAQVALEVGFQAAQQRPAASRLGPGSVFISGFACQARRSSLALVSGFACQARRSSLALAFGDVTHDFAEDLQCSVEPLGHDPRGAGPLAQQLERPLEHGVGERAAPHRLRVGLGPARAQHVLDQPAHATAGERLEPARRLGLARGEQLEHRARGGGAERRRLGGARGGGVGAPQLVRRGRVARGPGDVGEQARAALLPQLVGEQRSDVVEERGRRERLALLVGRAPGQEQHVLGPGDRRVEQRPLAVEHVLVQRQPQSGGRHQPAPVLVGQERLRHRAARKLPVLEPADEDGAEAPRADRERVGEQDARGGCGGPAGARGATVLGGVDGPGGRAQRRSRDRRGLPHLDGPERFEHVLRAAEQPRVGGGQAAQLGRGGAQVGGDARIREVLRGEHRGTADVRRGPDRVGLRLQRAQQRLGALGGRRGERVERVERRAAQARLPGRAGGARAAQPAAAHAHLERVGERHVLEPAGGPQPGEQVRRLAPGQRRARSRQDAGAEPGAGERHAPVVADRDAVAGEHLGEQRGRAGVAAQQHRDLGRLEPLAHQLEHGGADQLGLGALAARLEQPHRPVGRALGRLRLEQRPLQVVQRGTGGGRVVLRALRQRHDLGERPQLLDDGGAAGERDAARLVRQRHEHVGAGVRDQRLDGVALDRREVVEAVEEDGPPAPRARSGAQRVERRPRIALPVGPAEQLEPAPVGRVEGAELARIGRAAAPAGPGAERGREARRRDERALQLGEERAGRAGEARRRGRARERVQPDIGDRRADDPVARDAAQRARFEPGTAGDLPHEAREGQHLGSEHDPRAGQLALVVLDVGRGRHDEQRVARSRGAQALEHGSRLRRVGRPGDQGQGHRTDKGRARGGRRG